jgi:hypothetical protein
MKAKKNRWGALSAVCTWALAALLAFALVGCPNPSAAKETQEADKTALTTKIAEAEASKDSVKVSTDGADVSAVELWVLSADKTKLETKIALAQQVNETKGATADEVSNAVSSLETAIGVFNTAKKMGTKTPSDSDPLVKTGLETLIANAKTNRDSVTVSADGSDVPAANQWVTGAVKTIYDNAITTAETSKTSATVNSQVAAAMTALNTATTAFNTAKRPGTGSGADVTRYYIDNEIGNDANDGKSPKTPWKSFKNANAKEFQPGDQILLEADSVWNGTPVSAANYQTLLSTDKVGMLWPKGSGTREKPCVIDRYDRKDTTGDSVEYTNITKRPVINGNGTPSRNNNPYAASGAIQLQGQHFWTIRNIEVTNSFQDFSNPAIKATHWYNRDPSVVLKALLGIYAASGAYKKADGSDGPASAHCIGIVIENCYAHDVQSEHNNNGGTDNNIYSTNTAFGARSSDNAAGKTGGGIIVEVTDSRVEGNIVRRVALEGIRTNHGNWGTNVIFRGNYIETVAGDGMVMSRVDKLGSTTSANNSLVTAGPNLVESNFIKDACAAPNLGTGNYASNWCYFGNDLTYQYNEGWGTLYGNLDGEAWDIDNDSKYVTYQYNYSHHNAGGAVLFMSNGCENGIFRYNISANDGGSSRYLATIDDGTGAQQVDETAYSYAQFSGGQSLIHYVTGSAKNATVPLVYNNTFYIGDGISTAVYGTTSSGTGNKFTRFYNNILLKAGAGSVTLLNNHNAGSTLSKNSVQNISTGFTNNIFWAPNQSQFDHNGSALSTVVSTGNNYWVDPGLKITADSGAVAALRAQRDNAFPEADYNDPEKLKAFTSKTSLRSRASLFAPATATSSAIDGSKGKLLTSSAEGTNAEFDGGWYDGGVTKDFFDNPVDLKSASGKAHVGAAGGVYTP